MAVVSHGNRKFGAERNAALDLLLEASRSNKPNLKYGTASIRKQREAKLLEMNQLEH